MSADDEERPLQEPAAAAEADVERIHRLIFRESRDPVEGREPPPWWLWAGIALAIFWAGWYLGRRGGTFDAQAHTAFRGGEPRAAAPAPATAAAGNPIAIGQGVYVARCQSCHQADGMGIPSAFPPLRGSEWVVGSPERAAMVVLDGLHDSITVAGKPYNGVMPPWRDQLSDAEIAAVLTYARQWSPNAAPAVDVDLVRRIRAATAGHAGKPWTDAELAAATGGSADSAASKRPVP